LAGERKGEIMEVVRDPNPNAAAVAAVGNVGFVATPIDKPPLANPPPGWEDAVVPPGTLFPIYERQAYYKSSTGRTYLMWYRAYYWLPRQRILLQLLTEENQWITIDEFDGPQVYHALNSLDGRPSVMRMIAA
jgi:hypothetical protein